VHALKAPTRKISGLCAPAIIADFPAWSASLWTVETMPEINAQTPAQTAIPASFLSHARRHRQAPALMERSTPDADPTTTSYQGLLDAVLDAAAVLIDHGVQPGDRVCVHVPTSIAHTVWDLATLCVGAAAVPVYDTDSVEQVEWILTDADPAVLVGSVELLETSTKAHRNLAHRSVILEVTARATTRRDDEVLTRIDAVSLSDIAGIIYTSGTTGRSKGCVLTHGAFASSAAASRQAFDSEFSEGQRTLLFLPLAHVFARVVQYVCLTNGVEIAYSSPQTIADDVAWARPTWMVTVPRVLEKVHAGARAKSTGIKRAIFDAADQTAQAWALAAEQGKVPRALQAKRALFDRLVYGKIRAALGGELRTLVSGGAALDARLDRFFTGCGITVYEGYGLTETSAAHCANIPGSKRSGSVGKPLDGFEAMVDSEGEVLLRGANLFAGYWRNGEASAAAMTGDWFRTGDLGAIDGDGFLRITGRRKELIVTSNGKNVQPVGLEEIIVRTDGISQCVVVGDARPFITALVALDPVWVAARTASLGCTAAALAASDEVNALVQGALDAANATVSRAEAVKTFRVLPEELSVANGLLTPTLKVKRQSVATAYADLIEAMYATPA
jgi:long-chain acyl-CoA synthetase